MIAYSLLALGLLVFFFGAGFVLGRARKQPCRLCALHNAKFGAYVADLKALVSLQRESLELRDRMIVLKEQSVAALEARLAEQRAQHKHELRLRPTLHDDEGHGDDWIF